MEDLFTKSTENHDSVLSQAKQLLEKINRSTALHTGYLRFFTLLAVPKNQQEKAIVFKVREETGSMKSTNK